MGRGSHTVRRAVPLLITAAIVAVAIVLITGGGASQHHLWAEIPDATGIVAGEPIRDAGVAVGEVSSVTPIDGGREARIELSVDRQAWPMQRGTIMHLRWGGTISYLGDYVDVLRPRVGGADYTDGATLPRSAFTVPVQFDTLIDDFTPSVRSDLRSMITSGGPALAAAQPGFEQTLRRAPAAVAQANLLLGDLNGSRGQLQTLITTTGHVVGAFDAARPTVEQLVSGAAQTLGVVASRASALQTTLSDAPGSFDQIRSTLGTADRTLELADTVTARIGPGVTQLHATVAPLDHLLSTVTDVAPDAEGTLTTAARSAPQITRLLAKATALMPAIASATGQAVPALDCIRPYTPDDASLFTNWAGFISGTDGTDFEARILPSAIPPALTNISPETPVEAAKAFPGLTDSFPRAPGEAAGQPWFQPQCGITPNYLTPAGDPETGNATAAPLPAPTSTAIPAVGK
jgi:ABC-type transporter Mla subunit MlaD